VARCGTNARKSSAGYDLVGLMTGSEGTLGVITSVTVRLHPVPDHVMAAVCTFGSLHEAAEAVSAMLLCSVPLERCELLDAASIGAFNRYAQSQAGEGEDHLDLDLTPTLFLEFSGPSEGAVEEQVQMAQSICSDDFGAAGFRFARTEQERKRLWSARHSLYYAAIHSRPGAQSALVTDACVPLSRFADLVTETAEDVRGENVVGFNFGHAGDGNFHCILPLCQDDPDEYLERVHRVNDNLIRRTIEVGGTCTGEHGVGYGKMKYLPQQYGDGGVEFMRRIKKAIDPMNIMNPGKIVEV
jgi:D-lactate dehydrogenase (cytochrome)